MDWTLLLTPLLVLPIVLLFRFTGCKPFDPVESVETAAGPPLQVGTPKPPPPPADEHPPEYRGYILGEKPPGTVKNPGAAPNGAEVIAYWRLVDSAESNAARDEKGFRDGEYRQGHVLPIVNPTASAPGSLGRNPAHFVTGQNSLIDSAPGLRCRYFDGGYVFVAYKPGLYSDQFTIEAWIAADLFASGFEHTLFDAGGRYSTPAGSPVADRGFRLFVDRAGAWQLDIGASKNLFANPPLTARGQRTHVALTVANADAAGIKKNVILYQDGKPTATASVNSSQPPHDAPLFIGVANTAALPTAALILRYPVLCRIQEVVLHRKALSQAEIENHVNINRA